MPRPCNHHRRLCRRARRSRRGALLVLVMIVVVMVSLAGFSFVALMRNEDKATRLRGEQMQAQQMIRSAEVLVKLLVQQPPVVQEELGGLQDNPQLFRAVQVGDAEETGLAGRFSVVAPRLDRGALAGYRFGLENESAKLHLADVLLWEQQQPDAGKEALLQLPGMTDEVADAILDWLDPDDDPRPGGAESEYYASLAEPYLPRSGMVESLEELLLVRGVTRQLLFGFDSNQNHQLEDYELPGSSTGDAWSAVETPEALVPWSMLLTVHSAERNVSSEGQPRINLNNSDLAQLHQQLSEAVGMPLANFIVAYRQYGPYRGRSSARGGTNVPLDFSRRARHRIKSPLDLVGARVRIRTTIGGRRRSRVYSSPLGDNPAAAPETLLQLLDRTTVVDQPVLRGRINVNLAPPQVLAAIPGMDDSIVERIMAARETEPSGEPADPQRRHPVWLLLERLVDLPRMKQLLPWVTCGGDVYRAQLLGRCGSQGPVARAEVVVDATQSPPRQVYWKDLSILGRGYGPDVLEPATDTAAGPTLDLLEQ